MTAKERREIFKKKARKFIDLARSKKFNEEAIKVAGMLAISDEMKERYGDSLQSFDKVIELCEQFDDEEEFLQAVLDLAGID